MRGKLIVIEGTDCSGKETQSKLLEEKLNKENIKTKTISFPMYDTPTGLIVGACYLGKEYLCSRFLKKNLDGFFREKATKVDPIVASQYFAADRRYNMHKITDLLDQGINVIADRYVYSNMAHQGGKIEDKEERAKLFNKLELLEFNINELPKPDIVLLLYVPYSVAFELKKHREEKPDQHEKDALHLMAAERTYLELADLYNFEKIECTMNNKIKSIEEIEEEIYCKVRKKLRK